MREAPGEDPPRLVIHNDRAREELGWRPRPVETTIVESAECLRDRDIDAARPPLDTWCSRMQQAVLSAAHDP